MGRIGVRYHHMGIDYRCGAELECPHCGKPIFLEARITDDTGDDIVVAFAADEEDLDKEFRFRDDELEEG